MSKKKKGKDPDLPAFHLSRMEFFHLMRLEQNPYLLAIMDPWIRHEFEFAAGMFDTYPFREEIQNDEFPVIEIMIEARLR